MASVNQHRTIAGRYELAGAIGRGGMGEVWAAYDTRLDRQVALKLLRPDLLPAGTSGRAVAARFVREARLTARLEHPGVPAVFDAGTDGNQLYLVMQLIAGSDLGDVLAQRDRLPLNWAVAIGAQIAAVLAAAHSVSLVHRDLKPRNVMLSPDGTIKVLDFGVAALLDPEITKLTAMGETIGSPAYMAPEQITSTNISPRSDLYALGCLLHELLSGQQVFAVEGTPALMYAHLETPPRPLRQLRPDLPQPLEQLILDLLAKDPDDRPASAEDVYERLVPFLPAPNSASPKDQPALPMDPTRPYRHPMAPRPRPEVGPQPGKALLRTATPSRAEVAEVRNQAADLAEQGRFTQAAELLASVLSYNDSSEPAIRAARLQLAGTLLLGGQYRRALPEYQRLVDELTEVHGPDDDEVLRCRAQVAICHAELGELTAALAEFRALLEVQQRLRDSVAPETLDLRRQIGLLLASSGDLRSAWTMLSALSAEAERALGINHPDVIEIHALLERLHRMGAANG